MLERMAGFHAVAGMEHTFAGWLEREITPYANSVIVDRVGNVIARKGKTPVIGLFAHMDSVGFMVKKTEGDIVEVVKIGKPKIAQFMPVVVLSQGQEIPGLLLQKEEKLFVDVGSKQHTQAVRVGDFVTFPPNYNEQAGVILSRNLDNKIGCYVALQVFKQVDNVIFIGTVREENRPNGASVAARALSEHLTLALVIDVTYDENILSSYHIHIGNGPAICLKDSLIQDRVAGERLVALAETHHIPHQVEVLETGGSDANTIAHEGIPTLFVGVPLRYMHSPTEVAHRSDIENTIRLLAIYLEEN